jgi:hypothetical protein
MQLQPRFLATKTALPIALLTIPAGGLVMPAGLPEEDR